jgi:4-methyl-5(b-hydroxyethyl)-thiazole monophosphate biosynthesis
MVYVLLAQGFEEIEAVYPIDVLRRCGTQVKTVAVGGEMLVTGSNGITIKADTELGDVSGDISTVKMLILPGGPGRTNIIKDTQAMEFIKKCAEADIAVAAICGAPEILHELGLFKTIYADREYTCYPGLEKGIEGGSYIDEPAVTDGNLITSQAAGTSNTFAFEIADFLCGEEKSDEVGDKMKCW